MPMLLPIVMSFDLMLAAGAPASEPACRADLVAVNGHVYTVNASQPWAEAIAVCGDRIARVGTTADVLAIAAPNARRIDLQGRTVIPGFNDSHVHLVDGGTELTEVDLRDAKSGAEAAARIAAFAKKQPKGRWILGGFWDHERWPGQQLPTRALIDAVTPDNPVFVQRLDGHMGLANSLALKLAGITRDTPVPSGGAIVKDAAGDPTGILKDNANDLITKVMPAATFDETMERARAALQHAASVGLTTVQDMTASGTELRVYQALRARGELPVRITSIQNHPIDGLIAAGVTSGFGDDWLRIGGQKFFADGAMGSGTAAFYAPYADDPSTSGLLLQSPEALRTMVFDADAAGFQIEVHAIGDRANAVVLDIFEQLAAERGVRDRRPRIEHAQVVRDADKARFARLGVVASIQPSHCTDD